MVILLTCPFPMERCAQKNEKAVDTHGLAQRHQDVTRRKAVGVAIAHGLV
jgi:hypothetical protein